MALTWVLLMSAVGVLAEETLDGTVVLPASQATFDKQDKGVSPENKKAVAKYDKEAGVIWNLAQDAAVTFTVPDGVDGVYDVYLNVSRTLAEFTSQPFSFVLPDGEAFSVPMDTRIVEEEGQSIGDTGRFLMREQVALKSGDTVQVLCTFGAKDAKLKGVFYPGVGNVELVPAGTNVGTGYDRALMDEAVVDGTDPLSGKTILWVGSSVTYGAQAKGHYSMVDAVRDLHPALQCEKYAINATTLVNQSASSYVNRLKLIPKEKKADLVVVQLSTNDATTGKSFGSISESKEMADFVDTTIAGAIETIIAYAQDTFHCPVVIYTGTYCEKENYAEMVVLLHQIEEKWGIGVIDLFNNPEMTAVFGTTQYEAWMGDQVHPNREGYVQWWTPVIDAYLVEFMGKTGS